MASEIKLKIKSDKAQALLEDQLIAPTADLKDDQVGLIKDFLGAAVAGMDKCVLELVYGQAKASGTLTVGGAGAQTVTIAGVTLEGGTDYEIVDLSEEEIAANIVAAVLASEEADLALVTVETDGADVVVTAKEAGLEGNFITLAATGDVTASGDTLEGGTAGTLREYNLNLVL